MLNFVHFLLNVAENWAIDFVDDEVRQIRAAEKAEEAYWDDLRARGLHEADNPPPP